MSIERRMDPTKFRWGVLIACAAAMLAVANVQYAWTLFTPSLTREFTTSLTKVQWAFTFFVITQSWLMPVNTHLVDRFGARAVISVAALLVGAGWIGAGYAHSLTELYVVYAIGGIGVGAVYGASVGLAMKWFYNRRGLCVGLVAGSYGFGTALTAIPISKMITAQGYRTAFITWGIIQGVVVLIASQFMIKPPAGWQPPSRVTPEVKKPTKVKRSIVDYTPRQMLKSGAFYLIYLMMVMVAFGGLMATAQLAPIGTKYGYDKRIFVLGFTVLNLAVPLNQVLNGVARPFFGTVADRLGRYDTMALVFGLEALAIATFTTVISYPIGFVALSALIFFAFGDIYSSFPSAIADIFGAKHSTTNYGIQYTAKGFGAVLGGPFAAWITQKAGGSWLPIFWLAFSFNVIAALLAVLWLKPMVARRMKREQEISVTQNASSPVAAEVTQTAAAK